MMKVNWFHTGFCRVKMRPSFEAYPAGGAAAHQEETGTPKMVRGRFLAMSLASGPPSWPFGRTAQLAMARTVEWLTEPIDGWRTWCLVCWLVAMTCLFRAGWGAGEGSARVDRVYAKHTPWYKTAMTTVSVPSLDLAAYLARIGHDAPVAPTLATLSALVARHAAAIPFENLDPLLGRTPDLTAEGLMAKLVVAGRGGYCFEHNLLLKHVLEAIGFQVTGLAARVRWNVPAHVVTPRSHMLLRVDLPDGAHVVDVGFGGLTLTGVLRLDDEDEQATPHEPFRLVRDGEERHLQALVRGAWSTLYRFDLQPQLQPDYEVTNYFLSNFAGSHFRSTLIAARAADDARYALRNGHFSIHRPGGESEVRDITAAAELKAVLATHFQVALPDGPELDAALARVLGA